ncbi:hypothetical protein [Hyphomonas sp.]|uniref:hypothetical protein n=2 Tax=Hyphomonas sp. TaxID=87 RepID=UPI0030034707
MPAFSLFQPLPGLPWHLLLIWPLIFWRIQRLRAWFRQAGGPGAQILWAVTPTGQVVIVQLSDDLCGRTPARPGFDYQPSRRFREAVHGKLIILTPDPCPRRMPGPPAARDPGFRQECRLYHLPRPDT